MTTITITTANTRMFTTGNAVPLRGPRSVLHLWQLISPALPVGAYSYSGGLEYAIDAGWVETCDGVHEWIALQLREVQAHWDIPVLSRLHGAFTDGDAARARRWNALLRAGRESAELEAEDLHLGESLIRLLSDLDVAAAADLEETRPTFAMGFALACAHWDIGLREAAEGYLWAWCENQVAAAVKLVPLGQTDGQRLLLGLMDDIREAVDTGLLLEDEDIGASAPGVALASALHETQYTRLFRS